MAVNDATLGCLELVVAFVLTVAASCLTWHFLREWRRSRWLQRGGIDPQCAKPKSSQPMYKEEWEADGVLALLFPPIAAADWLWQLICKVFRGIATIPVYLLTASSVWLMARPVEVQAPKFRWAMWNYIFSIPLGRVVLLHIHSPLGAVILLVVFFMIGMFPFIWWVFFWGLRSVRLEARAQ